MSPARRARKILVTIGLLLLWVVVVICALLVKATWFAAPRVVRGDLSSIKTHLARSLDDAAAKKRLGSAALVLVKGGEITSIDGFGIASVEIQSRVKSDQTLYRIASVSKAVTAWGVMKLVEEGKLSLDEPVMRHLKRWQFPGSEAYRDKVTVRQLLSHTSGLDDGLGYGGFGPGETVQTLEESLNLPKDSTVGPPRPVRVATEPGTGMYYGSAGYTILQLLIEEVTKQKFADYMKHAVLQPLGMTKASFDLDAIVAEGRAPDLATSYDSELNVHPQRRYTSQAGVALFVTPEDLGRFIVAYTAVKNPVLSQETIKEMLKPQPATGGTWGLGQTLYVANDAGGFVTGHDGGSPPGWGAMLRVNPATGNGMALMVSGGSGAINQLSHDWTYWETGKITFDARRQIVQSEIASAALVMIVGALAIVLVSWKLSRVMSKVQRPLT